MPIEFDYREESSKIFGKVYRPIAKIKIMSENKKKWINQFFYIDSGADFTIVPYKLGLFLGFRILKNDKVVEVEGINGVIGVVMKKAYFGIGEHEFFATIGWAQVEHIPMLLGRREVFNKFDVTFREADFLVSFNFRK